MNTRLRHRDEGYVSAFVVVILIALLAVAGLVLDAGLALSTKSKALDAAQSAARAGANTLDLTDYRHGGNATVDPAAAETAAREWLAHTGYTGTAHATRTTVTVAVEAHQPTQLLSIVGIRELDVTATATARIQDQPGGSR